MSQNLFTTKQTTEYPMAEYLGAEAWKNGCSLFPSATDTHPSPISWEKVVVLVRRGYAKSGEWRVESQKGAEADSFCQRQDYPPQPLKAPLALHTAPEPNQRMPLLCILSTLSLRLTCSVVLGIIRG